ncbi:hypothetical protein E2562_015062 [Oryza meyeriana var. granulata]|uniref:Uncharacterized protein n=1 Tax=Oryza meyeriana var. granulata TaxID=110450 RepID=A0A6G1EJS3_9ORYZ|nr:hypothetical protein E2562_015062 [Oryza meyeriana var. granulata]
MYWPDHKFQIWNYADFGYRSGSSGDGTDGNEGASRVSGRGDSVFYSFLGKEEEGKRNAREISPA